MRNLRIFTVLFFAALAVELPAMLFMPQLRAVSLVAAALFGGVLPALLLAFVANLLVTRKIASLTKEREFLKTLGHRNSLVIEAIGEAVFTTDINGNVVFINVAAEKILGFDKKEIIGKPSHELFHYAKPDGSIYQPKDSKIYAAALDGKAYRVSDEVFWKKDGTAIPVAYIASPFIENGNITGVVVSFHPIIERKNRQVSPAA